MSWSESKQFMAFITDALNGTNAFDVNSDTLRAALYNDTITPSQIVAAASARYGAGVWTAGSGPNIQDATGWPYVGRQLLTVTSDFTSNVYKLDAADTVSANASTTLAPVYGTLVYDDSLTTPVIDQGVCYNYFGGECSVTAGTFTIVWHDNGVLRLTL